MYLHTRYYLLIVGWVVNNQEIDSEESDYQGITVLILFRLMFRCSVLHAPCSGDPGLDGLELVLLGVTLSHWVGSD